MFRLIIQESAAVKNNNKHIGVNIMSKVVIPEDQNLYPTPNEHVNFEFENSIEEYRTSRYLNGILKMFGPDVILRGLDIRDISWSGDDLSIELNPGALIQDSTLINILYSFKNTLSSLSTSCQNNSDYYVVIYTQFEYTSVSSIPSNDPHIFNIRIGILDTTNHNIYNGDPATASQYSWNTDKNRLLLFAAPITDLNSYVLSVNIDGNTYSSRGARQGAYNFNYDTIECFSVDGGRL